MARTIWVVVLSFTFAGSAVSVRAQERATEASRSFAETFTSTAMVLPPASRVTLDASDRQVPDRGKRRAVDEGFVALGFALGSAMSVDTYSTFASLGWCPSCQEENPYAAPFVSRGPLAAYATGIAFDVGVMGAAAAMRKSANPALRKIWWAPAVALILGHGFAARHNFALRESCNGNPACGRAP